MQEQSTPNEITDTKQQGNSCPNTQNHLESMTFVPLVNEGKKMHEENFWLCNYEFMTFQSTFWHSIILNLRRFRVRSASVLKHFNAACATRGLLELVSSFDSDSDIYV